MAATTALLFYVARRMSIAYMSLRTRWKPTDRFLVRHKDAALIVVEKKAGVLSQRTESGRGENMLTLLRDFLGTRGRSLPVLPVHRLDRDVSGLLVYARRPDVQEHLIDQFARHTVERIYIAAVQGLLEQDTGTISSRLYTNDPSLVVYSIADDDPRPARDAVTHYCVLERFTKNTVTLIEVKLQTGIRNQIRVHFSEAGHPLLGERKYQDEESSSATSRIFLHATHLGFEHPLTHAWMQFESELPPDLAAWRRALESAAQERKKR